MRDLDPPEKIIEQEQAVRKLIQARLAPLELVHPDQQEAISYRLGEIFVAAKTLYTDVLPRFMEEDNDEDETFEVFGEARMNLLHLKDLIEDFEELFLESLSSRQEEAEGEGDEADG